MALVFDIETIGHKLDELDETTQEYINNFVEKDKIDLDLALAILPFTGEIVAIGVLDSEKNQGVVYFQGGKKESKHKNIILKPATEKEMLGKFWAGAKEYNEFVGFNSRCFDVPYIIIRSMFHNIKPSKDLMTNRYLGMQRGAKHIDLVDQFSFYGALRQRGRLHMWCNLLGITSPKSEGISGDNVKELFEQKKFKTIAEYNARDIIATNELYQKYLKFLT